MSIIMPICPAYVMSMPMPAPMLISIPLSLAYRCLCHGCLCLWPCLYLISMLLSMPAFIYKAIPISIHLALSYRCLCLCLYLCLCGVYVYACLHLSISIYLCLMSSCWNNTFVLLFHYIYFLVHVYVCVCVRLSVYVDVSFCKIQWSHAIYRHTLTRLFFVVHPIVLNGICSCQIAKYYSKNLIIYSFRNYTGLHVNMAYKSKGG